MRTSPSVGNPSALNYPASWRLFFASRRFRPARHLLRDRTVDIALREHVAEIHRRLRLIFLIVQGRDILSESLAPHVIQRRRRVGHAGLGMKSPNQLVDVGHLRHPARADERADGDFFETGFRQCVEQTNFIGHRNPGALDLQTVAHSLFR